MSKGKKELNLRWLVKVSKKLVREYNETGLLAMSAGRYTPSVQIHYTAMAEVSPLKWWSWSRSPGDEGLITATVMYDGVDVVDPTVTTNASSDIMTRAICKERNDTKYGSPRTGS